MEGHIPEAVQHEPRGGFHRATVRFRSNDQDRAEETKTMGSTIAHVFTTLRRVKLSECREISVTGR
jgi:hypothetical protein